MLGDEDVARGEWGCGFTAGAVNTSGNPTKTLPVGF